MLVHICFVNQPCSRNSHWIWNKSSNTEHDHV